MSAEQPAPRRYIFGWPLQHGGTVHAVLDNYRDPQDYRAPEVGEFLEDTFGISVGAELANASFGDPSFTLRGGKALCGVRGHLSHLRVVPEEDFSPEGCAARPSAKVCAKCVRVWSTTYAPQLEGWTKTCASCGQARPVTAFASDGRTKDKLAARCERCIVEARRTVAAADHALERAAQRHRYEKRLLSCATKDAAALDAWQHTPWLETVTCDAPSPHVLRAVATEDTQGEHCRTRVQWRCACGSAEVDAGLLRAARALAGAGDLREVLVGPVAMVSTLAAGGRVD